MEDDVSNGASGSERLRDTDARPPGGLVTTVSAAAKKEEEDNISGK